MKAEIFTRENKTFDSKEELCYIGGQAYRFGDASMPRILEHLKNGAFIISAMTGGFPVGKTFEEFAPEEKAKYRHDVELTKQLKEDIRAKGLGYIPSLGGYIEEYEPPKKNVDVNEFSFIVPKPANMDNKTFVDIAVELMKKYDQQSVAIGGIPEIDNGQIRYLRPADAADIDWEIDPDYLFSKTNIYKNKDLKNRPYYTNPIKLGERNFTFTDASMRKISDVIGISNDGEQIY